MTTICVIGATSAIATACVERFIETENSVKCVLLGRNTIKLEALTSRFLQKGAKAATFHTLDIAQIDQHEGAIESSVKDFGIFDIVIVAHATTPDQIACEEDANVALEAIFINGSSVISLLTRITAKEFVREGGTIAVISSVAGDRGRRSNYVYGSAKSMLTAFSSGLRSRLLDKNINVLTVKPGYVDTPLNDGIELPKLLVVSPEYAGRKIVSAIARRRSVKYVPFFWYFIMGVIRVIPEPIFKRLNF